MGKKKIFYLDPDERKWTMEDLGLILNPLRAPSVEKKDIEGPCLMNYPITVKFASTHLLIMTSMTPFIVQRVMNGVKLPAVILIVSIAWQDQ